MRTERRRGETKREMAEEMAEGRTERSPEKESRCTQKQERFKAEEEGDGKGKAGGWEDGSPLLAITFVSRTNH